MLNGGGESGGRVESALRQTALVAAVFSVVVLGMMAWMWRQERRENPLEGEMKRLKTALAERPADESVKAEIRALDLRVREGHVRRMALMERGAYLLLGGLLVAVGAIKLAGRVRARGLPFDPENLAASLRAPAAGGERQGVKFAVVAAGVTLASVLGSAAMTPGCKPRVPAEVAQTQASTPEGAAAPAATIEEMRRNWPAFRGADGAGVAGGKVPAEWDGERGEGIAWKAPVPLPGNNSPIVWEQRVFLSGATGKRQAVFCFDAATGKVLWERDVPISPGPAPKLFEETGHAPSTMATDGARVYVIFPTGDLACFDMEGKQVWSKALGRPDNQYGHASSLLTYGPNLMVQWDQGKEENSALIAFDGATGREAWRTRRPVSDSWSSPTILRSQAGDQIIASGNPFVIGYDAASGREIWRAECMNGDVAPSPAAGDGIVYVVTDGTDLTAIRTDGKGDVTKTHIAWTSPDSQPEIVSPVVAGDLVMALNHGMLTCFDGKKGTMLWELELGDAQATPIAAAGRVYLMDQEGVMHVLEAGREAKEIAKWPLGEEVFATPAFAGGRMFVRGVKHLYCVEGSTE